MSEFFCLKPWENLLINNEGECFFCCFINEDGGSLGNIRSMELEEIWHSPRAGEIRKTIARGELPLACSDCALHGHRAESRKPSWSFRRIVSWARRGLRKTEARLTKLADEACGCS